MSVPERPCLRPGLAVAPADRAGLYFLLGDRLQFSRAAIRVTALELESLRLFDGARTLREIQSEVLRGLGGQLVPLSIFEDLARRLDEALFLDSPRFRAVADRDVRPPSCIGCYEGDPVALRAQMRSLFTANGASGLPGRTRPDDSLCAALLPHIDYARGGITYTWAFKEIAERSRASLFVIIGTSHFSGHRFTLTRKNFQTPLGIVPTDQHYLDRLVAHYGDGLFDDELMAHLQEHSIELEVVILQYLFEGKREFRIVPLVVGSFRDAVHKKQSPAELDDVGRMIEALQTLERETSEPICYLISGDLAHLGPKFGDDEPVNENQLAHSKAQDQVLLKATEAADAAAYFRIIASEGDERRICGLPPTFTTLGACRPTHGRVLHYDQYVHPKGFESVSFASAVFYR